MILRQQQTICGGGFISFTHPNNLVIPDPLMAFAGSNPERDKSLPDQPSGRLRVFDFSGGLAPYETRITLDSASVQGQTFASDWEEVTQNPNTLRFDKVYEGIPAGRYSVEVRDSLGCEILPPLVVRVGLDRDVFIPNVFTPNNDNVNETFFIRNLDDAGAELVITNRWGRTIYSDGSYQGDWDAEGVADGVYFYRLNTGGQTFTGWVEVQRGGQP